MRELCENPPKANIDALLSDGKESAYFGGMKVVFTPGHTPGYISLYLKKSRVLIAGDSFFRENIEAT
ncbi:glyoxylase-like metal-dependent hydrolase (beta-lactamase superfamily II) [Bacillus pakistanensis]|uniref:Glyoxylase-like metal-dependent hydrolase (Beta-lactamase superfamily II) n=2 Tax=Rossellomorea pakistanensis TaxID=992288 RepID=A0ABS2NC16_9BACI|nr:glyoxylase-like metal-dependent hydrolase (beta-lactamase superfamily II) [Bacillus pakistanensis]